MSARGWLFVGFVGLAGGAAFSRAADVPRWERPPERQAAIRMFNAWKPPVPARTLLGNIHYVGTSGIAAYLITTPAGHILIDTGFDDTVPHVLASIEQLGFRPRDIKFLLSSHAHVDHVGGHARMKALTGATVVASAADARIMTSGGADDFSPFPKDLMRYTPLQVDRIVAPGNRITLGQVNLTAHLTPGHTAGATTWTMRLEHAGRSYDVVFLTSLSIVQGTPLLHSRGHPGIRSDYEASFRALSALPCDVFFGFHVSQASLDTLMEKLRLLTTGTGPNPFHDPQSGWKAQLASAERAFREQLAAEQRAAPP